MSFYVDNTVLDIAVNGKWQGPLGANRWKSLPQSTSLSYNGYTSSTPAIITMTTPDWQAGSNTLTIYIASNGTAMAFAATMTSNNACAQPYVPPPSPMPAPTISRKASIGLAVLLGLIATVTMRTRRRD